MCRGEHCISDGGINDCLLLYCYYSNASDACRGTFTVDECIMYVYINSVIDLVESMIIRARNLE